MNHIYSRFTEMDPELPQARWWLRLPVTGDWSRQWWWVWDIWGSSENLDMEWCWQQWWVTHQFL